MDKNVHKIVETFGRIIQFYVLLDLESSEPHLPTLFYKERHKSDTLAVIDNHNFYDTQTQKRTLWLYDQPSPEGRVGEKVNKLSGSPVS